MNELRANQKCSLKKLLTRGLDFTLMGFSSKISFKKVLPLSPENTVLNPDPLTLMFKVK